MFWSLRCATVHFWLRPSKTPFRLGYVQELVHGWPFVRVRWPGAAHEVSRRFLDLGIVAGAVPDVHEESQSLPNLLLVSRRHSAKGAPRVSFGSALCLDPFGKGFMRPLHKSNFRAFFSTTGSRAS